jgi:hypothetical protein
MEHVAAAFELAHLTEVLSDEVYNEAARKTHKDTELSVTVG